MIRLTFLEGPNHVEVAEVLNSQGLVLKKRADYDGAEKLYKRAIDIVVKTFGEKHYKVGIYMNNLGDIWRYVISIPFSLPRLQKPLTYVFTESAECMMMHSIHTRKPLLLLNRHWDLSTLRQLRYYTILVC